MKTPASNTIDLKAPENWNSLTRPQLRTLCRLIASGVDPAYRQQLLFLQWTGLKALPVSRTRGGVRLHLYRKGRQMVWMSIETYRAFLQRIGFSMQRSSLVEQLLPSVRSLHRRLYGPSKKLFNITYGEFIHAEAAYNRYLQQPANTAHLNALCAVLYRPGNGINPRSNQFKGDRREPFNDFVYMRRARWFKWVPIWQRVAVFLFYTGCREALYEAHDALRNTATIGEDMRSDIEKHRELVHALNQGDVTKTEMIYKTNLWQVFGTLNSLAEMNAKLKKR